MSRTYFYLFFKYVQNLKRMLLFLNSYHLSKESLEFSGYNLKNKSKSNKEYMKNNSNSRTKRKRILFNSNVESVEKT